MSFRVGMAGLLLSISLAGCATLPDTGDGRHLVPIPAALLAEMQAKSMTPADPIMVRIFKEESELEVWKRTSSGRYALLRTYPLCRWSGQLGPKRREGDRQAPEGFYTVRHSQMNPRSQFHLSFDLGYPNSLERALGYTGSALMVHGACTSSGCFAITDDGVSEVYALAREAFAGGSDSFQVQAFPFRLTPTNLARHRLNPHAAYWANLREGNDHFEALLSPPSVAMCGGKYRFNARPRGPSARLDPLAPCPELETDASADVAAKVRRTADDAKVQALVQSGMPAVAVRYADGNMHSRFRAILRQDGAERLRTLTSNQAPISRPEAVLTPPVESVLK